MYRQRGPQQFRMEWVAPAVPDSGRRRLLQAINERVDFGPVYAQAQAYFCPDNGRPSLDPVLMVKVMLVGYLFGVGSDRALVEFCADSLSVREFLGLGLDESLPVHSSFTHWRQRLGAEFFREFLHEIARQCVAAGLVIGGARTVDATFVKAQASKHGPRVEVPKEVPVEEFLDAYFAGEAVSADRRAEPTTAVNLHDPEARLQQKRGVPAEFGYQASFSADAETGVICDATATDRERAGTAVEHVDQDPFPVEEVAADSLYDASEAMEGLVTRGVQAYVPQRSPRRPGGLSKEQFTYDPQQDVYRCPRGKVLRYQKRRKHSDHYVARVRDCRDCPLKPQCTPSRCRTVTRPVHEASREQTIRAGPRYEHLQRRRHVNEYLHSLAKRQHGLRRARAVGLAAAMIQACLTAAVLNLKKLVHAALSSWPSLALAWSELCRSAQVWLGGPPAPLAFTWSAPVPPHSTARQAATATGTF